MTKKPIHFIIWIIFISIWTNHGIAQTQPDWNMMSKIRHEGFKHSQVMHTVGYLSDVIGPRPTGSPAIDKANHWTADKLREWGLQNVRLEPYENFGIGWAPQYISVHLLKPHYAPFTAISIEWGSSTDGEITGQPVYVDIRSKKDFEKYRGTLRGKIIFYQPPRENMGPHFTPPARRFTDDELDERAQYPIQTRRRSDNDYKRGFLDDLEDFFRSEKIGVLVRPSREGRGDYNSVRAEGIRSARHPDRARPLPEIILSAEHYNRVFRIMHTYSEPVEMAVKVKTEYYDEDLRGYNVIAEIPGTKKKDEIVMLGGHIDSWSPGTGAADNAAGCAVNMEAIRILQTLGVKPLRTIRLILWSAEEKGWVGSKTYVENHYGDVETMALKPEHAKLSAYFNFDYGHGRIRGIHLQDNIQLKPLFDAWFEPFHDLGATHVITRSTGGSDHGALDYIGLPSFQWIQDPLDYMTRIHHTNNDVYDHLIPADLIQSSVIIAGIVYQVAMHNDMLPRKPLPDPMHYPVRR